MKKETLKISEKNTGKRTDRVRYVDRKRYRREAKQRERDIETVTEKS